MSDYLQMPWNVEDTIDNMDKIRCSLIRRLSAVNLDGKAEQDVAELNYDFGRAINALKENQQYHQIGTPEECRKAVEKQISMKVTDVHVDEYYCPACGAENNCDQGKIGDKYCPECGQAIVQEGGERWRD